MEPLKFQSANYPPLPWRANNNFNLLINGDAFFPEILHAIQDAQQHIAVELYLCESGNIADQFIEALCAATSRGVVVKLLFDHLGSQGLKNKDRRKLNDAGIELRFYNKLQTRRILHNLARDHRKIITIDNRIAFVGGAGIKDAFDPETSGSNAWRELMIKVTGPVVSDWRYLFDRAWLQHEGPEGLTHWREKIYDFSQLNKKLPRLITEKPQARVNGSRGMGSEQIKGALVTEIRKAKYTVWIATAYFYPPSKILRALRNAAKRGVDVRLLLPGPKTDHPSMRYAGRVYYEGLLKNNVKIYEYQPNFMHMKIAIVDDWVSVGSCNFDRWNLRWNLEANLESIDPVFARQSRDMLVKDFQCSELFSAQSWPKRPFHQKLKERFWTLIGMFIEQLFYR